MHTRAYTSSLLNCCCTLQRLFCFPCAQMPLPPHSLQLKPLWPPVPCVCAHAHVHTPMSDCCGYRSFLLPCEQMLLPPQSRHCFFCRPMSHPPKYSQRMRHMTFTPLTSKSNPRHRVDRCPTRRTPCNTAVAARVDTWADEVGASLL